MKGIMLGLLLLASGAAAAEFSDSGRFEAHLASAVKSHDITVIHLWAPWCPNCRSELASGGWNRFLADNPRVHVIFVTIWNAADGRAVLEKYGVGAQPNFTLYLHPNTARRGADKVSSLLGLPISWIPTTWIFQDGRLAYALNYGELHFSMLQQLVADTRNSWEH